MQYLAAATAQSDTGLVNVCKALYAYGKAAEAQKDEPVTPDEPQWILEEKGKVHSGEATYYDLADDNLGNAGLNDVRGGYFYAAMNTADYNTAMLAGAYVEVTGPKGSVDVYIVDRLPEGAKGDIDLDPAAFEKIADKVDGRVPITWKIIPFDKAETEPMSYRYKTGATKYWFEMQVFKHHQPSRKLILYLHGGAFIYPPVFFHWRFLHDLALRLHSDALLPVYPKAPEHDCRHCVSTLLDFYPNGIDFGAYDEIHFVGDSAGAHLCLVLAQEAHKNGWPKPKTITLLSPCVDLSHTKEKEMRALQEKDTMLQLDRVITLNAIWQGDLPAQHPWVSPVFGDFSGVDNLNVFFGTDEILQPDDLFLKETYEKAGKTGRFHEFEGMFHTFAMFPIPEGFKALRMMVEGIKNPK